MDYNKWGTVTGIIGFLLLVVVYFLSVQLSYFGAGALQGSILYIFTILTSLSAIFSIIFGIAALVLGILAFRENKKMMALVLGMVYIAVLLILVIVAWMFTNSSFDDSFGFQPLSEKPTFYQFKIDLETSVQRIYSEYGSVRIEQFNTPGDYQQICFVDLNAPFNVEMCRFDQYACDLWKDAGNYEGTDENIFLQPTAPVKIKVYNIKMEQGFLCLPIHQGRFEIILEGRGEHAYLSLP